jgi:hypothetical protein
MPTPELSLIIPVFRNMQRHERSAPDPDSLAGYRTGRCEDLPLFGLVAKNIENRWILIMPAE